MSTLPVGVPVTIQHRVSGTGLIGTVSKNILIANLKKPDQSQQAVWNVVPLERGFYKLIHHETGYVLDGNGSNVYTVPWNGSDYQQWQIIYVENDFYKVVQKATGKVLDGDGSRLYMLDWNSGPYQQWMFTANNSQLASDEQKKQIDDLKSVLATAQKERDFYKAQYDLAKLIDNLKAALALATVQKERDFYKAQNELLVSQLEGLKANLEKTSTDSTSTDLASLDLASLKSDRQRMIDKRQEMWQILVDIIDKYNETARGLIESVGR